MPRFFVEHVEREDAITLTGEDARHIALSLRMAPGERLIVCETSTDTEYDCIITAVSPETVVLAASAAARCAAEPDVRVHLFQALPKGDKLELIIQKAVELGVHDITPVLTRRCISRPDAKSLAKKTERWQKIAAEAAKQSGRGRLPRVNAALELPAALAAMAKSDLSILFYELGGAPLRTLLQGAPRDISVLIGAEGGFEEAEVQSALALGVCTATLGKRILRCETAPLCALSVLMYATGNLE